MDRDTQEEQDVSAVTFSGEDTLEHDAPESGSFEQRRADALTEIAESYLANGPTASSGDRYQVMLHVCAETLADNADDLSNIENGAHVSAETSRRLSCEDGHHIRHWSQGRREQS